MSHYISWFLWICSSSQFLNACEENRKQSNLSLSKFCLKTSTFSNSTIANGPKKERGARYFFPDNLWLLRFFFSIFIDKRSHLNHTHSGVTHILQYLVLCTLPVVCSGFTRKKQRKLRYSFSLSNFRTMQR